MISENLLSILHSDIQIYDKKNGKDYLITFNKGKKDSLKYCQLTFYHYNFWHLLGCKTKNENSLDIYKSCRNKQDISKNIALVHSYTEAETKHSIFEKIFDFVANAKFIKLGYIGNCPEKFYLTMSIGNEVGFVGYDYTKNDKKKFLIPKSVQDKKLSIVTNEMNKILFILSKEQTQKAYINIEYEIKNGVVKEYLSEISKEIPINLTMS